MAERFPVTEASLRAAMREPRYWRSGNPEREGFNRWVTEGWQALVREGEGGNGTVDVRAYTRTRNGKTETEQVGAHTRGDPPGGEAKAGSDDQATDADLALPAQNSSRATPPLPRPGITSASDTLVIFVGGGGDSKSDIVRGFQASDRLTEALGPRRRRRYAPYTGSAQIMEWVAAEPQGTRIVLVGHSYGGDTAAQVAATLGAQDRPVDTLITVDPVGRGVNEGFLARVRAGSREWVNIRAYGVAVSDSSDRIAALGSRYGASPRGYATRYIEAPYNHGAFNDLLRYADPTGVSGFSRLLGQ